MSTTDAVKPARKFPPPCWTRDEALVLIEAYRERWYALHRAFLRNPDWDAVAEKVTTSCPDVTPPKTSAQCRHKMGKLRQRHRDEKQRASSFPGGSFFSSWFYFEAMEAMENGPNADPNNSEIVNGIPLSDHRSLNPGRGIRFKPSAVQNLVSLANYTPDFDSRVSNHNWSNQEDDNETSFYPAYKNHNNSPYTSGPRKFSKVIRDHEVDEKGEMWIKVPKNICNPNLKQGKKRGNGVIREVVSSIKLLGDGFMKMEKMKIDMAREIERMRMETEMKRNQLILESQKQIVMCL
ncbi:hypothetical protein L1987_42069 [Smallanthus sonchifolius]|uniref:Uncharacterized protein n=1 Tax=Smallanthus sonchifolius TaxID=185202 RepID=A0ACB9GWR0_9ASTR|nr:hypothetical protein L1987_42069 [Smallanthus sonchifolius]